MSFTTSAARQLSARYWQGETNSVLNTAARGVIALSMSAGLMGCPSPSSYTTPRTVAPGELAHSIVAEVIQSKEAQRSSGDGSLLLPSYGIRYGVVDRIDVGARLINGSAIGADMKVLLLKGTVDVAIDPGVHWGGVFQSRTEQHLAAYAHLPLLVGLNLSESFSIVGSAGVTVACCIDNNAKSWQPRMDEGTFARFGFGLDIRTSPRFAVHPEVTVLKGGEPQRTTIIGGIGFNFGALPSF